jgi:hypothetical protein
MSYEQVKNLELTEFKRLCGVTLETFKQMVKVVADEKFLAKKSGRPSKLSIEDQVLMRGCLKSLVKKSPKLYTVYEKSKYHETKLWEYKENHILQI